MVIIIGLSFSGCVCMFGNHISGSGRLITEHFELTGFSGVDISHNCEATITMGNTYSLEVIVDENIREYLLVRLEGPTLKISLEPGHRYRDVTFKANIILRDLEAMELSGASSATLNGFDFDHPFVCKLSGASRVYGTMGMGDGEFKLSGACHMTLRGRGDDIAIDASGASSVDLGQFIARAVRLDLSGASGVTVHVTDRLDAEMSGASNVRYYGNPTIGQLSSSGASTLQKLGQ